MASSDMAEFETDVLVIGSGFGGSVAALRFAEAGESVIVLERGDWQNRDNFEADLDALWNPARHRFGANDLQKRGANIVPWLGSGVGGGSHVYAGTMKICDDFGRFPPPIRDAEMERYYQRAADIIEPSAYPDYPPYSDVRVPSFCMTSAKSCKRTSLISSKALGR